MAKYKKDKNAWDKKRLTIETTTAVLLALLSFGGGREVGKSQTVINYNGTVITQEIYADTVDSIKNINEKMSEETAGYEIAEFAQQFEGNSYEYGKSSLVNGADAGGFIQSVYAAFGFALPRNTNSLKNIGEKIPIGKAVAGDIVCYDSHAGIYIGDNKIIHASNSKSGIIISDMFYREPELVIRVTGN